MTSNEVVSHMTKKDEKKNNHSRNKGRNRNGFNKRNRKRTGVNKRESWPTGHVQLELRHPVQKSEVVNSSNVTNRTIPSELANTCKPVEKYLTSLSLKTNKRKKTNKKRKKTPVMLGGDTTHDMELDMSIGASAKMTKDINTLYALDVSPTHTHKLVNDTDSVESKGVSPIPILKVSKGVSLIPILKVVNDTDSVELKDVVNVKNDKKKTKDTMRSLKLRTELGSQERRLQKQKEETRLTEERDNRDKKNALENGGQVAMTRFSCIQQRTEEEKVLEAENIQKEQILTVPEYVGNLDINYHQSVTKTLTKFLDTRNSKKRSDNYVMVVTGPSGCGKTFSARHAIKNAGYDIVEIDMMSKDINTKIKQAFVQGTDSMNWGNPNRKKVRAVLIDAVEGLEPDIINKITKFANSIINLSKVCKKGKKDINRALVSFWLNPIILTCNTKYDKKLSVMCMKLRVKEIKCPPLTSSQKSSLLLHGCNHLKIGMDKRVFRLSSTSYDMTYLLNQLHFISLSTTPMDATTNTMDDSNMDVFKCVKYLFDPPCGMDDDDSCAFDSYNRVWERGDTGHKLNQIIFNSYPMHVSSVPKRLLLTGLDQMTLIADSYVDADVLTGMCGYDSEFSKSFSRRTIHSVMTNTYGLRSGHIDVKTHMPNLTSTRDILNRCRIGKDDIEKLRYVNTMFNEKSESVDYTKREQIDDCGQYELRKYIGKYYSLKSKNNEGDEYEEIDMFQNPDSGDSLTSVKNRDMTASSFCPRSRAIKLLSHQFTGVDYTGKRLEKVFLKPTVIQARCITKKKIVSPQIKVKPTYESTLFGYTPPALDWRKDLRPPATDFDGTLGLSMTFDGTRVRMMMNKLDS